MSDFPTDDMLRLISGTPTESSNNYLGQLLGGGHSVESPTPIRLPSRLRPKPNLLAPLPPVPPTAPSKTSYSQINLAQGRFDKRLQQLREVVPVGNGRVVPDTEDLTIGDARRLKTVSVLFLDICKFSTIDSGDDAQQDLVFMTLSLFMTEMLHIVRDHQGHFEKNTGDGLMAYFDGPEAESTQRAVDAAVTMHCYNDQVISPKLLASGLPAIKFRVGIETGLVTIARIGVRGDHNSLVAVGNTPNIACKLMTLIEDGGIVLGNSARSRLPESWKNQTVPGGPLPGFIIRGTQTPYPAWVLTYRAPDSSWAAAAFGILGGGASGLGGKGGVLGGIGGK
jgi:adenylate cyclase